MIKTDFKHQFDVWKNYVKKIGEMILNDEYSINRNFQKAQYYSNFKEKYENKFIKYMTNERFFIPIIGKISSGKSTFLNSILQGDYLSCSSGIDTKMICILRNNKETKVPILYKCELILEKIDYKYNDKFYYYFEKKEKVAEGENILKKIKCINEELKVYEEQIEIKKRNIQKYFYLLEIRIPLFDNNDLGELFDFVDIPGLNEKQEDFYIGKIIPYLVNKCLFSIYIFDVGKYENKDTSDIYKAYSKQLAKYYNKNSLYILNKIDSVTDDKIGITFDKFKVFLSSNLKVNLETNIILKLNSKKLYNKVNALSNLKTFILHLADKFEVEEEKDENPEFFDYIKNKFINYFKIDEEEINKIFDEKNNIDSYVDVDEKEYDDIYNNIVNKGLPIEFEEEDYKKMKYIFTNKEPLNQSKHIPVYEEIYKAMENNLNDFFNWNNVEDLFQTFKNFIEQSFSNQGKKEIYINMCDELINSFKKELDRKSKLEKTKFNVNLMDRFKVIIDSLIKFEPHNKQLTKLKGDFDSLTYFIYNYRRIRIPLLGGYSTGKSSFLNNLIGQDILPVNINKCTNRGIIIRHSKKSTPQLFRTNFIKLQNPIYWYFKDEEKPICEGYEAVKAKLLEINEERINSEESAFLLLKIPLRIFSNLDYDDEGFKKQLEDKLELIDFPGLDVNNNFYESNIFGPLMMFSDGFIFVNDCDLIEEAGNINILINIVNQIKARKFSFSYHSCLFLLHKYDKSLDLNIEKSKNIFKKIFAEEINDDNKKKDIDAFNVNKFSSKLYSNYREFENKYIKNFELFLKYIIDNTLKIEEKKKIKNYSEFLNLMNKITKKITFQINKKLAKKKENKIKYNSDLNDKLFNLYKSLRIESCSSNDISENFKTIENIYSNYLYIYNNYKMQNQRVLSNADGLFKSLYKLFKDSYEFTEKQFETYFYLFVKKFNNLFILIDIKIFGNQFKTQLIVDKIPTLINKTKKIYQNSLESMKKSKDELYIKNYNISNDNINLNQIEESIQNNIDIFSKKINTQLYNFYKELNIINKEYKEIINDKEINGRINACKIKIDYSRTHLNKNTEFYEISKNPDFFGYIGNIFKKIGNSFKEDDKIKQNIDNYLEKIKSLIENYFITFNTEIDKYTNYMLRNLEDTLMINNNQFNGLRNNRIQYEIIKDDYLKIIEENNI